MKSRFAVLAFLIFMVSNTMGQVSTIGKSLTASSSSIPGDNTMRYYRLAIPVTYSAYVEDLGENYNNVLQFWGDCEEFANRMFVPLGICFDVVEDQRLVKLDYFPNEDGESFIYTLQSNGTSNTNDLIGEDLYDVGMWVHHREVELENSGLSVEGGVYSSNNKGSGYSKTDKWVVAHELGHMFGAPHTTTGEGSLMDSGGDDFFSYPSIKKIRDLAVGNGAGSANNAIKVSNNAPVFNNANMKDSYRIPQGACIAIPVYANDADGNMLTYSAIGCSSSTVGNIVEGGVMPHFASVVPQTDNVIDYRPKFTADIFYDDFYYEQDGTNIPAMNAGSYNIAILVNDVPASMEYDYLTANPFYSNYAVWDATVQIVGGTAFNASMSPAKNSYSAGEQVTVSWGVNSNYFTADSRLRITMSTDYGKTFAYVLADDVPALDGSKAVTLPNVNVGNIDVDFKTATRSMRGGIIRVEEIGGVAYTLTTLSPTDGKGFNITGGSGAPITYTISVIAGDGGTATIDGKSSTTVVAGSSVTLTATPNDGYIFDAWYSGGSFVSQQAEYTFTPTASGTYNAQFVKEAGTPVTYKITATANPIAGGTATVNGGTSATVEANGTIELSAKANGGYTFVNWTSGGKEVTTQADYKIYNVTGDADYIANFKLETTATEYPTPTGNTYTDNYLTSITTTGGDTNIDYSANAHPGQSLVVVPGKVQLEKGQSFTMNLIAKSLGEGSNSIIREDMRYCHASLFTDFDQDFTFEASPVHYWGNQPPTNNVYGNYDNVMNITHTITVPDDAPTGESHVRMIYTNAWNGRPANGTAVLDKGIVYDIVVEVVEKVDITANAGEGGSVTINGEATGTKRVIKGSSVTLNATPASGYSFLNWSSTEGIVSETAEYTFTANSATTLTANFEIEESQDGLTTGYYHIVSRVTTSHEYLYNNALRTNNSKEFTLQSDSKITTNNGIWYITVNSKQLGVKNGDGNALVTGAAYRGNATTHNTLNIEKTTDDGGVIYYSFLEGINCTNRTQYNFTLEGGNSVQATDNNYVTTWTGHPDDQANQWRLEPVDTDGKNIYDVVVECTEQDVYVVYGSGTNEEYAFNGGFFITNETITAQQLTAKKNNAAAQDVTISVEDYTIRVVDIEYVDITVSTTPPEGGTATINGEATGTKRVVKGSEVTLVANANDDYNFTGWYNGETLISNENPYTFTATASGSYEARFEVAAPVTYTVSVVSGEGGNAYIGASGTETETTITAGENVTLRAEVTAGYEFDGWYDSNGKFISDVLICTITPDDNMTYTAKFYALVEANKYYKLQCQGSNKYYLSSNINSADNNRLMMNGTNRIFYYGSLINEFNEIDDDIEANQKKLLAYTEGNFVGIKKRNTGDYYDVTLLDNRNEISHNVKFNAGTNGNVMISVEYVEYVDENEISTYFYLDGNGTSVSSNTNYINDNSHNWKCEEVTSLPVAISSAQHATLYAPVALEIPDGVRAYVLDASKIDATSKDIVLTRLSSIIPANTGVILKGNEGTYDFNITESTDDAEAEAAGNALDGTVARTRVVGDAYILAVREGKVGLYPLAGNSYINPDIQTASFTNGSHKAYLPVKDDTLGEILKKSTGVRFLYSDEIVTGIQDGILYDGAEGESIYDLQGRKLSEITEPGIYIVNGKKRFIK